MVKRFVLATWLVATSSSASFDNEECFTLVQDYTSLSYRTGGSEVMTMFYPGRFFFRAFQYERKFDLAITAVLVIPGSLTDLPGTPCTYFGVNMNFYRLKFVRKKVI